MTPASILKRMAASENRSWARSIGAAVLCVIIALLMRMLLVTFTKQPATYLPYFPAIVAAAVWAGRRGAVAALALCVAAVWGMALVDGPRVVDMGDLALRSGAFVAVAGFVAWIGVTLRETFHQLHDAVTHEREEHGALQTSERRMRLAQDVAGFGLFDWNIETGEFFLSEGFLENWGVSREVATDREALFARVHPDDRDHVRRTNDQALATGQVYEAEYRIIRDSDQAVRWLYVRGEVQLDAQGKARRTIGVNQDITERKAAEALLKESESRFRAMADSAPAPIWVTAAAGGVEFVNRAMTEFFSAEPERLTGHGWRERMHPDDYALMDQIRGEARRRRESYIFEARFLNPAGEWRWMRAYSRPRFGDEGAFLGYVGIAFDVTDIRATEAALRESEQRFRLIADSAPVPMWVSRLGGARDFVNSAYAQFLDASFEQALAEDWRDLIHPDDIERIREEQVRGEASQAPFTLEARYRRADGAWRWLRSFSQPRWGPDGEHVGFIGVAFDVTEAKQAAQDLQRINDLLEERVSAALEQKEVAEAALLHSQKIEAVGRLTGGVAHDFNNLLTVVIGALDMILKHPGDTSKRIRMAEAAMAAARRGERLTHQLLAFSRRQALRPEVLDVHRLLAESEPLLRRAVGEQTAFAIDFDGHAVVRVDPGQFEAALLNLVVNARDATPPGGAITITSAVRDVADARAFEAEPGRYLAVSVKDTGAGMPAEVAARAFEPFFTTKPVGKGTGLGLSQVYGFARQSGGGVTIDSSAERGTTMTLYLPLATEAADVVHKPAPAQRQDGAALRVLLVEDDPAVGAIAEAMLLDLGHEVDRADSADPALELLRGKTPFDLLLTDVIMPGPINGVALAHEAVTLRPGLQVLLTSGYAGDAIDETLASAPWPFLKKPYAEAELALVLQGVRRAKEPA